MELLRAWQGLLWPLGGFLALALGSCVGYAAKGIEDDLQRDSVEGLCRASENWTAFVSTDEAGYVCFKEHITSKKIIKYIIVEREK